MGRFLPAAGELQEAWCAPDAFVEPPRTLEVKDGGVALAGCRKGAGENALVVRVQIRGLLRQRRDDDVERRHRFTGVADLLEQLGFG